MHSCFIVLILGLGSAAIGGGSAGPITASAGFLGKLSLYFL